MPYYAVTVEATRKILVDANDAAHAGQRVLADLSYEAFGPDWEVMGIQELSDV